MKIKISEIIRRVYGLLDENEQILEERMEYGDPETMLRPLIIDLLPDAARIVIGTAPLCKFDDCRHLVDLETHDDGMMTAELPRDFLRLLYIKMTDWESGISTPLSFGGECHLLQKRRRSLPHRRNVPAVAVRGHGVNKVLEIYGSRKGSKVEFLDYVPVPEMSSKYIDLPPGLLSEVCAKTAKMVTDVIGV